MEVRFLILLALHVHLIHNTATTQQRAPCQLKRHSAMSRQQYAPCPTPVRCVVTCISYTTSPCMEMWFTRCTCRHNAKGVGAQQHAPCQLKAQNRVHAATCTPLRCVRHVYLMHNSPMFGVCTQSNSPPTLPVQGAAPRGPGSNMHCPPAPFALGGHVQLIHNTTSFGDVVYEIHVPT
jgi:hypothetical protein